MKKLAIMLLSSLLINCSNQEPVKRMQFAPKQIVSAIISPNGQTAAYVAAGYKAGVWSIEKNALIYQLASRDVKDGYKYLAVSHDNTTLATASKRTLVLWSLEKGHALTTLSLDSDIKAIALNQDGSRVLVGLLNAQALYFDALTGAKLKAFQHLETINSVALSNDNRYALTGSDDKLAILWDLKTNTPKEQWLHKKRVRLVRFSPSSRLALTAASQDSITLWQVSSGKKQSKYTHKSISITSACFSKDESKYFVGAVPNRIESHDAANGKLINQWRLKRTDKWKPSATFVLTINCQAKTIISADTQGMLEFWDVVI